MNSLSHISDEELKRVASGQAASSQPEVEQHISQCQQCQQRLLELAVDSRWHQDIVRNCEMFRDEIEAATVSFSTGSTNTSPSGDAFDLQTVERMLDEVLEPPTHPEMLGKLGRYDVESVMGSGGMGVVLRGFDRELHRPVAIKMILPRLAKNGTAKQRFSREARASATVLHPNVIGIHDIGESAKIPWFVMPLVVGPTLRTLISEHGPLPEREIVRIGKQIASGLAAAHSQGLVHRDIKPDNILVDNQVNRVIITDFGLARQISDEPMTKTGFLAGTIDYMSPEQSRGVEIDGRSDLFSLGSVLFFLATGKSPFHSSSPMATIHAIGGQTHPKIQAINNEVSSKLAEVIDRLLEKNPEDRFQSAAEVEAYLSEFLLHLQQPLAAPMPELDGHIKSSDSSSSTVTSSWHWGKIASAVLIVSSLAFCVWWALGQQNLEPTKESVGVSSPNVSSRNAPQETEPPKTTGFARSPANVGVATTIKGSGYQEPDGKLTTASSIPNLDSNLEIWIKDHISAWRELRNDPALTIEKINSVRKKTLDKFPPMSVFSPSHIQKIKKAGLLQDGPARPEAIKRVQELASYNSVEGAIAAYLQFDFAVEYPQHGYPEGESAKDRFTNRTKALELLLNHPQLDSVFAKQKELGFFSTLSHTDSTGFWKKFPEQLIHVKDLIIEHQQASLNSEYSACFEIVKEAANLSSPDLEQLRAELLALATTRLAFLKSKTKDEIDDPKFHKHYIDSLKGQIQFLETVKESGNLIGSPAPKLSFLWSSDEDITSWEDTKGKVCVLYFSTFGCGPCVQSVPRLIELNQLMKHHGMVDEVQFIGITSEQGMVPLKGGVENCDGFEHECQLTKKYIEQYSINWPIVYTKETVANPAFGVKGVPHMVIVDAEGIICDTFNPFQDNPANMLKRIGALVK